MNDPARIASEHLLKSTPETYDIDAAFVAELRADRAAAIVDALERAAAQAGVTAEWLTPQQVAWLETMTAERSGIVDEYSSSTEGRW